MVFDDGTFGKAAITFDNDVIHGIGITEDGYITWSIGKELDNGEIEWVVILRFNDVEEILNAQDMMDKVLKMYYNSKNHSLN